MKLFYFIILVLLLFCNYKSDEEKKKKEFTNNIIIQLIKTNNCVSYNLPSNPSFDDLKNERVFENCKSCHTFGGIAYNKLNVEDYNDVKSKVSPYSVENSLLYKSITVGSMAIYSNSCINEAVKKWIESGAN